MKPYGFIFLPYWIVKRRWFALITGTAALWIAFLLPAAYYGLDMNVRVHREWYSTLTQSTPAQLGVADNVSVFGFLTKWLSDSELAWQLGAGAVIALGLVVFAVILKGRGRPRAGVLECALLLTLIPLVSPLGWDYQLLTSVLAVTLIAHDWWSFPRHLRVLLGVNFAVISLSIYDVMGRAAYGTFMNWSVLTVNYLVVVAVVAYARFANVFAPAR